MLGTDPTGVESPPIDGVKAHVRSKRLDSRSQSPGRSLSLRVEMIPRQIGRISAQAAVLDIHMLTSQVKIVSASTSDSGERLPRGVRMMR